MYTNLVILASHDSWVSQDKARDCRLGLAAVDLCESRHFNVFQEGNEPLDSTSTISRRIIPLDRDLSFSLKRSSQVLNVTRLGCCMEADMFRPGSLADTIDSSYLEAVELGHSQRCESVAIHGICDLCLESSRGSIISSEDIMGDSVATVERCATGTDLDLVTC